MKLELHQGTDSHTFPTHLAGANERTDEIDTATNFHLSATLPICLLLTLMPFSTLNGSCCYYQQYLNFTLRLDSTSPHLFQRILHDSRAQTLEILSTLVHQVLPFELIPGLRKLLKQEGHRQLQLVEALPKVAAGNMAYPTRNRQGPFSGPE